MNIIYLMDNKNIIIDRNSKQYKESQKIYLS